MYQIIGCLPTAPQQARTFIGGMVPQDDPWNRYVIKSLPAGMIIQSGDIYLETVGDGTNKMIDGKPADLVTNV